MQTTLDKNVVAPGQSQQLVAATKLILQKASEVRPKRIEWLWPNRIPKNKLTIFSGNPDVGKSLVTVDIVARLTMGRDWPDGTSNSMPPSDVLMLIAEDAYDDTVVPRLIAAGADLERVHFLKSTMVWDGKGATERQPSLNRDLSAVEEAFTANRQISLFTVDPVSNYLGGADINSQQEVREVLIPLRELAERVCVTGIVVGHFNKTANVNAIHKVGGSAALTEVPRAGWSFSKDPEDPEKRLMLKMKCNLAKDVGGLEYLIKEKEIEIQGQPTGVAVIEWGAKTERTADDVLRAEQNRQPGRTEEAKEWLQKYLAGGAQPSEDCEAEAEAAGISGRTLWRAKKALKVAAFQREKKWWWELPVKELPVPPLSWPAGEAQPVNSDSHTMQMAA